MKRNVLLLVVALLMACACGCKTRNVIQPTVVGTFGPGIHCPVLAVGHRLIACDEEGKVLCMDLRSRAVTEWQEDAERAGIVAANGDGCHMTCACIRRWPWFLHTAHGVIVGYESGIVCCMSLEDGRVLWGKLLSDLCGLTVAGETIYCEASPGVVALDSKTGKVKWAKKGRITPRAWGAVDLDLLDAETSDEGEGAARSVSCLRNIRGEVLGSYYYVRLGDTGLLVNYFLEDDMGEGEPGRLVCSEPDGTVRWERSIEGSFGLPVIGVLGPGRVKYPGGSVQRIFPSGDRLLVEFDSGLVCLDKDGNVLWRVSLRIGMSPRSRVLPRGDSVYVVDGYSKLVALGMADGRELWSYSHIIGSYIMALSLVDSKLYVLGSTGLVTRIAIPEN